MRRVALQPFPDVVVVELLGPDQAGQRLALHAASHPRRRCRLQRIVELVGLRAPLPEDRIEVGRRQASSRLAARRRMRTLDVPPAGTSRM